MKISTLALIAALLAACSPPLAIQIPINRMDTPQTQGAHRVALNVGPKGASRIEFVDDIEFYQTDPPDEPKFSAGAGGVAVAGVDASVGLARRLDVAIAMASNDTLGSFRGGDFRGVLRNGSGMVKFKFQPLGPTLADDPVGKFSLAVTAAVGVGNVESNYATKHRDYDSSISTELYDIALIAGVYPSASMQLYGGLFKTQANYDGNFSYQRDGVLRDSFAFAGTIKSAGWSLGVDVAKSRTVHFIFEFAHANVEVGVLSNAVNRVGLTTLLLIR